MKTKLIHGKIVDGSGIMPWTGEILIEEDKILKVGTELLEIADQVIDLEGMMIVPGFIDTHCHSGTKVFRNVWMDEKLSQGITTEIIGQDGIAVVPASPEKGKEWNSYVASIDGEHNGLSEKFHTTGEYLDGLRALKPAGNFAYLVPYGNLRMEIVGLNDVETTEEQMEQMEQMLRRELEQGAIGMSAGMIYVPCLFGSQEELIRLCKVVAEFDGVFAVHQRSEANDILESMEELIDIAKQSEVKLHISHFKICGLKNQNKLEKIFQLLDKAHEMGISVSYDQYPYVAGCTSLLTCLPPWARSGSYDEIRKRLEDEECREKIKQEIKAEVSGWDNFYDFASDEGILVIGCNNMSYRGKNLKQIGQMLNVDPLDGLLQILSEDLDARMVDVYGTEETLKALMKRPEQNFCTDSEGGESEHPRNRGSYARVLGKYVRDEKVFSLPEAIHHMTGRPAQRFRIPKRGLIKEGYYADFVVFDSTQITD
ncbi:MAG: D-aminoacylase, partial [Lachnospiraceae bacterium]|nr:D-aminoacylase [Lachnospiraceae bacterium]